MNVVQLFFVCDVLEEINKRKRKHVTIKAKYQKRTPITKRRRKRNRKRVFKTHKINEERLINQYA